MKIAMTSYYLPSGSKIGVGHVAHRFAQVMSDRGHDVTMFSPNPETEGARYTHVEVPLGGSLRTFRWALRVRKFDLEGFDVFHAHSADYLRAGRRGPPHVRTMHGSCFAEALNIGGLKGRLRMFLLGLTEVISPMVADVTVAVSQNTRRYYPWIRRVIPNGVDIEGFSPGEKDPTPTVMFVGTYERRKRGRLLMEKFATDVLPAVPDAKLWMVCSDAPAAPSVDVLGVLADAELSDRYRRAWVFSLPSTYEGFGVPYIEALASGTAVVATSNPGSEEVLRGGQLGMIVPDDELGSAIVRLLTDEHQRLSLEERGRRAAGDFSWDSVASRYEEIYEGLTSGR